MMNPQHLRNWQAAQTPKQRRLAARVIGSAIARPKTEHDKPPFVFIRRNPPILIDRENLPVRWADPRHYAHLISYLDLSGKMRYLTQDPPPGEPGSHARIPQPDDDDAPTIYPVDRLAHPPLHYDDETPSHLQTLRWIQEQLRTHHIEVHLTSQHLAQLDHAIPENDPIDDATTNNPVTPAPDSVIPAQAGTDDDYPTPNHFLDDHFPPDHQPPYNPPGYLPPLRPLPGDPALNTHPTDDDITPNPFTDDPVTPAPPPVIPAPPSVIPAQAGTDDDYPTPDHFPDDHFPPDHQPPYNPPGYLPPLRPLPGDPALNTHPTDADDITHNPITPAQAGTATPAQPGTTTPAQPGTTTPAPPSATPAPPSVIPAPPPVIPAQAGTRPPQPNPPDLSLLHNQHPLPPHIIQRIRQRQRRRELEREYGPDYDLRLRPNLTVHIRPR